jgi:hypothetical protein
MEREYISDKVPDRLREWLEAGRNDWLFRRRAVLSNGNSRWELVCCTVEGFGPADSIAQPVPSRRYAQVLLYEDVLTGEECLHFARELHLGHAKFDNIDLRRDSNPQWTVERLSANNDYMACAGYLVSVSFGRSAGRAAVNTLIAAEHPYYPDIDEAARDWLPLAVYHGHSDARNEQVLFLLPETRAFFSSAKFSEKGTLEILVAGSGVGTTPLRVKGAYWEGKAIRHFETRVQDSRAELIVPGDADRLEYYLIDDEGTVYDFHREDRFLRRERKATGSVQNAREQQVRQACESGEGLRIEFKPFIDPADKHARTEETTKRLEGTKLREILETVAAFANTEGGHIYLGVNDDCTVSGIGDALRTWAKAALDEMSINRYLGALKGKIKEFMDGEVTLQLSHAELDGMLVAIIDVSPAVHGPVALRNEYHLYVRSGASNRKARPDQWKGIISKKETNRP